MLQKGNSKINVSDPSQSEEVLLRFAVPSPEVVRELQMLHYCNRVFRKIQRKGYCGIRGGSQLKDMER